MKNKPFTYFDDFVIIFGKDKAIREGAEAAANAIEQDNDNEDEFVDTYDNYVEEPQDERQEENREEIAASTYNTIATSKTIHPRKKKAKSSDGTSDLVEQLVSFQKTYQEATQEIKDITSFFKKEAEGIDRRLALFFRTEGS